MDKQEAKSEILRAMKRGGTFCNNIVGGILRRYDNDNGPEAADALIIEMGINRSLGIMTNAERKADKAKAKPTESPKK